MSSFHGEGTYTMDTSGAAWLMARQAAEGFAKSNKTNLLSAATNKSTQLLIQELRFAPAKSIRTSTIILAVFNAIAAFATMMGILWENYAREKRTKGYSIRRDGPNFVSGPDVYPLFLSLAIMVQGIIFASAQSSGLDNLFASGCAAASQSMLPALVLVPAIQLIFGFEVMLRALKSQPFSKRGPWAVRICLASTALVCLAAFIVAYVEQSPDFCFAYLFWYMAHYSMGIFVVLLIITILVIIITLTIFLKLNRDIPVDEVERVSASRMVYYLVLAIISNSLILPFFHQLAFQDQRDASFSGLPLTLSTVASVVTEVSGLMTGGLYLFLRSNTMSAIGAKKSGKVAGRDNLKNQIHIRGNDRDDDDSGITSPNGLRRMNSDNSMFSYYKKDEEAGFDSNAQQTYANPLGSNAVFPEPPQPSYASRTSRRFKASSIFSAMRPSSIRSNAAPLLPATTYSPNAPSTNNTTTVKPHRFDFSTLKPPPSMKNLGVSRHRRDSSIASHITVQLGLRLSNVEDFGRPTAEGRDSCTDMIPMMDQTRQDPRTLQQQQQPQRQVPKPSPLVNATSAVTDDSDIDEVSLYDETPVQAQEIYLSNKAMQPSPKPFESNQRQGAQKPETLSPTVYSPQSSTPKMVSPRGVGFTNPPLSRYNSQSTQRSNSQRSTASKRSNSQRTPPPRKPSAGSIKPPPPSDKGSDWI